MDWQIKLYDSSRKALDKAAVVVADNPEYFEELFELAVQEKEVFSARASRVLYFSAERNPRLAEPYIKKIIALLPVLRNESVKRDFLRIFADIILPEEDEDLGRLIDYCFKFLNSQSRQISIKVYSIEILYKITKKEPELKKELALTIQSIIPYSTAAFAGRGRIILKKLKVKPDYDI